MVRKNPALTQITDKVESTPLFAAAAWVRKDVLWYLSSVTRDEPPSSPFTGPFACLLFNMVVTADIALHFLKQCPNLATVVCDNDEPTILEILASRPLAFKGGSTLGFWKNCVYSFVPVELNYATPDLPRGDMEDAIKNLGDLAQVPTSIISRTSLNQVSLNDLIIIISSRYIYRLSNVKSPRGKLPPSSQLKSISGSALQIQRVLQWFKEVENIISPLYKNVKNNNKKTAWEIFMEEHKELLESGEKWMKETSNSCMLVATLIATVVFAAAFTVLGGNANNKGVPIFLNRSFFMLFAISDALALFSSCTSLLIFLSILTSCYAKQDFLESLPKRLIKCLASLFFAIASHHDDSFYCNSFDWTRCKMEMGLHTNCYGG
ncbi:hypothetical protein L1049_014649 [Liquidambar formosana]|uniref:PGG domain-containing protein n=1 Tax=Liquidambar formosana TaxID=63359 RepID=A0AAP0S2M4_LIQFO